MKLTAKYITDQVLTCGFDYDGTHTACTITTKHGSKHVGTSACLDPKNYDREIGEQFAHKNAVDQLWALEGYFFHKLGLSMQDVNLDEVDVRACHSQHAVTVHYKEPTPWVIAAGLA